MEQSGKEYNEMGRNDIFLVGKGMLGRSRKEWNE